jgi:Short-chain dehydrogenases of various substrate specificities
MITGATSGIGLATATVLAARGARVVMVGRDPDRSERARAEVAAASDSGQVAVLIADLASLASIRALASHFLDTYDRLDVLINDAGVFEQRRHLSADGLEMTLAVNLVAPFYLTSLLLDRLRASAPARIVNVSSATQRTATIDLADLQFERRRYWMQTAYSQSKLGVLLFTKELARRLSGTGVTANAVHPGFVRTRLGSRGGLLSIAWALGRPLMISPEAGARTSVYVSTSPDVATVTGAYFVDSRPAAVNPLADDPELASQLWQQLEKLAPAHPTARVA